MKKRILTILAHGDDLAFGPTGTLVKYARQKVDVHLLIAVEKVDNTQTDGHFGFWEKEEIEKAASIIGISKLHFLDFQTNALSQVMLTKLTREIVLKILKIKPQIIVTLDPAGLSKNLDHRAVAVAVSQAFQKSADQNELNSLEISLKPYPASKLYHFIVPEPIQKRFELEIESMPDEKITAVIDVKPYFQTHLKAMRSQKNPNPEMKKLIAKLRCTEHHFEFFHLAEPAVSRRALKEIDLFENI